MNLKKHSNIFHLFILCGSLWLFSVLPSVAELVSDKSPGNGLDKGVLTDEEEFSRLLNIIDKHTEIATKSKLNADYVPGMVTVLDGKNLAARGIRNVGEALRLVPGIEVITGEFGGKTVSVRGLSEVFGYASNKFMVNNIPMNAVLSGAFYHFLDMPIEQVERLEVIRGPGSAVHGGYANTGVINVITRTDGNNIYGGVGSYATYAAGGLISWSDPEKDLHMSLSLSGSNTDGGDTRSGPDILYSMGQGGISNAPGPVNENRLTRSVITNISYKDFSFNAQYQKSGNGDYFGVNNALPQDNDAIVFKSERWNFDLNQRITFTSSLRANIELGYMSYEETTNDGFFIFPFGFSTPLYTYPYGMRSSLYYKEHRYHGAINLRWDGWERHSVFTEWSFSQTCQGDDTWQGANFDLATNAPNPTNTMTRYYESHIGKNRERRIHSIILQDEFFVSDTIDVTAGLRFDSYNDTDESLSPRLAGVWRLSGNHILKAQYARAYMPPSFMQLYHQAGSFSRGNDRLKPQTSENYELGYIYRDESRVYRFTLFHSDLEDIIALDEKTRWANTGGARLTGAEMEWEQSISSVLKLDGNISYADTEDNDTDEAIFRTANWWANLGFLYTPYENLILTIQYRYVGEQNREPMDPRENVDAYHTVDVTGNVFNLWIQGLTFRGGVKNIFDEDVRYAALVNTYPEDYPQPGRHWWCEISYDF